MIQKVVMPLELHQIEAGNYHIFIYVKVGRNKVRLLLDTGASKTAFDSTQMQKLIHSTHPDVQEMHSVGLGSSHVETQLKKLNSMRFGELKLQHVEVAVLDISHVNQAYQMMGIPEIAGVLGSDILVLLKAVINLEKKTLSLKLKV